MGIPYYVASLLRAHKHIQQKVVPGTPLEVDCLALDFNCFLHAYLKPENPVGSIVVALEDLLTKVVRARRVYLAFDGLVPYAKMVQQRYRRMRRPDEPPAFDKHQLSPGTPFMRTLADTLRFLHPGIVLSDTLEPGEGEHKIFQWLRSLPADQRKTSIVYGLDADLVLIALAQSDLSDMKLLREQETGEYQTFGIRALKAVLPMDVPTFVRMSLQFGNDFLPPLAMFSLREDGYSRALYHTQNRADPVKQERAVLLKRAKDSDRRIVAPDGQALEARFGCQLMDGVVNWEPVCYAYWKTVDWVYHYFTTSEVLDWMWVYPYPEAPLLSTLAAYDRPTSFEWEHPTPTLTVEDQLAFILPEASLRATGLPQLYPDELYDEATESRPLWMRKYAWESDPWVSLPLGPLTCATEILVL